MNWSENKNLPLVSIIIPTYNRSDLLKLTVESVLQQTYPNIEIIVVDDGSTDDTTEVMEEYLDRITYVKKKNEGGTAARNTGIFHAKGEYLNFLDHDDLFLPEKIEKQMKLMFNNPKFGLVHCGFYRIDKDGNKIDIVNYLPEGDVRRKIVCGCFLWSGAPLIRKECIDKVGVFDESVWSSDANMWIKISLAGYHFGCVQEPLGSYRILNDSSMADIERTEKSDMKTIDNIFADKSLPSSILKMENTSYFNQRFWLSSRYYSLGRWEDAKRNLNCAIKLNSDLLKKIPELINLFFISALDPRVNDPINFINNVFENLPENINESIHFYKQDVVSWVYVGISMRSYGNGKINLAEDQLIKAISLNSKIKNKAKEFHNTISDFALRLPVDPINYVDTILNNLPKEAAKFSNHRSKIISLIYLKSAYLDFRIKKWKMIPGKLVKALYNNPFILFFLLLRIPFAIKDKFFSTGSKVKYLLLNNYYKTKTAPAK